MTPKYTLGQVLEHRNGGRYSIVELPNENKLLEDCALPFYGYQCLESNTIWHRRIDHMEDGRFTPVDVALYPLVTFKALESDTARWEWLKNNHDNRLTVVLKADETFVVDVACHDPDHGDATASFDAFVGRNEGIAALIEELGIPCKFD
ncbi:MAG: hypothetical protein GY833_21695 [Aestuariibacter sp.]|nr:hypothetical protein [Aestuariibacter sp.]|tara:strand:- start:112865 stop:113311 length:447 start_codon:yes stop_codon:yes gene_type:complete